MKYYQNNNQKKIKKAVKQLLAHKNLKLKDIASCCSSITISFGEKPYCCIIRIIDKTYNLYIQAPTDKSKRYESDADFIEISEEQFNDSTQTEEI